MKNLLVAASAVLMLGGSLFADTIWSSSTGTLSSIPSTSSFDSTTYTGLGIATTTQAPFWNNVSADSLIDGHASNVGDVLAGLATGTNLIGSNLTGTPSTTTPNTGTVVNGSYYAYTSTDNVSGGGDPVTTNTGLASTSLTPALEFSFVSTQTALNISLLFSDSGNNQGNNPMSTVFGSYLITGSGFTPTQIGGGIVNDPTGTNMALATGDNLYANAGTVYGYYATVCYAVTSGHCSESITYTTGAGNFATGFSAGDVHLGALGWNHFALFGLANGEEVLGFEDSPWALSTAVGSNSVEGMGDFNDVVIGIVGNSSLLSSTPEPGTIAIMGLGLTALGVFGRRRFVKK